jgi:DNA invertase Pin-like site-specific DNA recombinase
MSARAFAYVRQSKARDEDEGDSLSCAMQAEHVRQWAHANGYEVSAVYRDQDISGRTDQRPAFQQMFQDIRDGSRPAAVIIYKYSRFARNIRVFANAHGELQDRGVSLLSATESADTRMVQVSALMADWYSTDLSEFTSAALHAKIRRGQWHGFVPFGYVKDQPTQRLVVDPDAAALVAEIFDRYVGGQSIADIGRWIRDDPALAAYRDARRWSYRTVDRLLRHRVYLGHTSGMDHAHPAIIDAAVFDRAQEMRRRPARYHAKAITSPLEGLVTCGACGRRMDLKTLTAGRGSGNRYPRWWTCASLRRASAYGETFPAHQVQFRADWIEDAARDRLAGDLAGMVAIETALADARTEAQSDATDKRRAALLRQRAKAQDGRDRLLGLFRDGRLDADRWESADRDAAAEVALIDGDLATLPAAPDPARYQDAARLLDDLAGVVGIGSDDAGTGAELDAALRRLLLAIGATVSIDARPPLRGSTRVPPSVTIRYGEPFARIIRLR